jgi:tetratricopeptide (TPR) repeat protein
VSDLSLNALKEEYRRLEAALANDPDVERKLELKSGIVALFKQTEAAIQEYGEFKETIRALIEHFKALQLADAAPVRSRRSDHIGASTFVEKGWTAISSGDWRQAELLLRDALALDPENSSAGALLGWSLMHQDRSDEALQCCLQVLVSNPEHGMARTAVGAICLRKGITGEAIEHLSRVLKPGGDPRAAIYARYWLGVAYLERDMVKDAVDVLRAAVSNAPNLAEAWAELGRAEWLQGNRDAALSSWEKGAALKRSPFASRAVELQRIATSGGGIPRSPLA